MTCNHSSSAGNSSSDRRSNQGESSWIQRHRGLLIGTAFAAAATALALGQHWIALVSLLPLLYILPCMLMMFMCMKGMNHGDNKDAVKVPVQTGESAGQ